RKKNGGADLRDTGSVGNRGTVVTGTSRDNSGQCALRRGCEQGIERTPQLERSSRQIDFNLLNKLAPVNDFRATRRSRVASVEGIGSTTGEPLSPDWGSESLSRTISACSA